MLGYSKRARDLFIKGLNQAEALSARGEREMGCLASTLHESAHFLRAALWTSGCVCRNILLRIAYIKKAMESARNFNKRANRLLRCEGGRKDIRTQITSLNRGLAIVRGNLMESTRLKLADSDQCFVNWLSATGKTIPELLEGITEEGWKEHGWGVGLGWHGKYDNKNYPNGICFSDLLMEDQLLVYQRLVNESGATQINLGTYSQNMGEAGVLLQLFTVGILVYEAAFRGCQAINAIGDISSIDNGCIVPVPVKILASAFQKAKPGQPLMSSAAEGVIGSVVTGGLFGAPRKFKSDSVFDLVVWSMRLSIPKVFMKGTFNGIVLPRESPLALSLIASKLRAPRSKLSLNKLHDKPSPIPS